MCECGQTKSEPHPENTVICKRNISMCLLLILYNVITT